MTSTLTSPFNTLGFRARHMTPSSCGKADMNGFAKTLCSTFFRQTKHPAGPHLQDSRQMRNPKSIKHSCHCFTRIEFHTAHWGLTPVQLCSVQSPGVLHSLFKRVEGWVKVLMYFLDVLAAFSSALGRRPVDGLDLHFRDIQYCTICSRSGTASTSPHAPFLK
jgi:hypothetical protein